MNAILSGSDDNSIRLWAIRSGKQIQMFNGHTDCVNIAEYSLFVVSNIEIGSNSNVICSGSSDNTICFWDIRLNKKELHVVNGDIKDNEIRCIKLVQLKNNNKHINLCYGNSQNKQTPTQYSLVSFISIFVFSFSLYILSVVHESAKRKRNTNHYSTLYWNIKIKLVWIHDFNKLVAKYVIFYYYYFIFYSITINIDLLNSFFMLNTFHQSSTLLNTFTGHMEH
ncbi:hypothetical protein RFI_03991 [Reticulomyxa filosa]|uniref:Uncharacterized protein n=1 Tax=Reticulomyxa filosa TaxID=46433 RepID=X6P675_RETFI|nr:hypothetical protein RFI_03991 [Reticulomyxa filosa]|eukprot:ETO33117.1 hypothetical protein RFI_03991 [Reticulomyxa filosa]